MSLIHREGISLSQWQLAFNSNALHHLPSEAQNSEATVKTQKDSKLQLQLLTNKNLREIEKGMN